MIWVDVDSALASVPVNAMPLLDDTDFKSIEASVAYNASGMALKWNFTTTAGVTTQTAVTPTTSGTYDWTTLGNGMYAIEIPASGGASINNDTEGFGWFTGVATGVLPWAGPVIGFRAAALNNSLIDAGTTGLLAPTVAARTLDVSTGGEAGVDWANVGSPTTSLALTGTTIATTQKVDVETIKTNPVVNGGTATFPTNATLASTTNITAGTVTTATNLTNAPTVGDFTATMKTSIGTAVAASAVASVTGNVGGNVVGSVGSVVGAVGSVTGAVGSVTGNVGGNVTGSVGSVAAGGITATSIAANAIGASQLAADAVDEIWDEVMEGTTTARQSLRLANTANGSKLSGAGTTTELIRDIGDTKDRVTATVDSLGNRTAITLDLT